MNSLCDHNAQLLNLLLAQQHAKVQNINRTRNINQFTMADYLHET